jgi:D-xylose reductase
MKMHATPILEPSLGSAFTVDDLHPRQFVDLLDQHKALILQSSSNEPWTTDDFGAIVSRLQLEYYPYIGGAAPRTIIPVKAGGDIVFTANERYDYMLFLLCLFTVKCSHHSKRLIVLYFTSFYTSPPDQPIPFHHELAQTENPPEYIFFYCHTPPTEGGGQTPIIDSTAVYRYAIEHHAEFMKQLQEHGARYIRTLPFQTDPTSPIGRSYCDTYNVQNRSELEPKLRTIDGCSWEWLPGHSGGNLDDDDASVRITSPAVPAIRLIPDHCQNYVFQYAFANSVVAAHLGWQDSRNDRMEALRFGNMDRMDPNVLDSIAQFMDENRVLYQWKVGDVMALNNRLVMHSRNPFTGPRRIFASIWGPPKNAICKAQPCSGVAVGIVPESSFEPLTPTDPLVFGFWKVSNDTCAQVCYDAIKAGYRRLDCACDYGNEVQCGEGIARAITEGICSRHDLFITSKLWNTYHQPDHVPLALQKSLRDLNLTYVDEYLIHFPISMEFVPIDVKYPPEWTNLEGKMVVVQNDIGATWKAMEELVDAGFVRSIGVCNFSTQLLRQLLSTCRIRPSTLQVELHPHNTQERLVRFARTAGIRVTAFSVLGASSYLELNMAGSDEVAKTKNKSPAQILLRWALQRNTLPLCKTSTIERMYENRNIFDFYLCGSDMQVLTSLNKNRRYNDPGAFCESGMGTFCPIYD